MTEHDEELEKLRETYAREPQNTDVATRLAQIYADRGWLNESYEVYKKLAERLPNDYSMLLAFGNICYSRRQTKEALDIFKKLTVLKPLRVEGWNNLGIAQLALEEFESAKRSFLQVVELEPQNHGALLNLGNYYDHVGNNEKAIEFFKRAIAVKPYFPDAWYNLGNAFSAKGEYEKAIDSYTKSLQYQPDFFSALKNTGFAYEQLNNYESAMRYYFKALERNKADASLYVNIATVAVKQNGYDMAKDYYLRAVKLSPHDAAGWLGLKEIALKKGDVATYIKATAAVIHRMDDTSVAGTLRILRNVRQYDAIDSLVKNLDKLERNGELIDAERMLAYQRSEKNRVKASLLFKKLSASVNPSDHLYACLAAYAGNMQEYEKAIEWILVIKSPLIQDSILLWKSLIAVDRYDEALRVIEQFLSGNPDCFDALFYRAKIALKQGRRAEAHDYLVKALEYGFSDIELLENDPACKELYDEIVGASKQGSSP